MGAAFLVFALAIAGFIGWQLFGGIIQVAIALVIWMIIGNIAGNMIRGKDYGVVANIGLGLAGGIIGAIALNVIGLGGILGIPLLGGIVGGVFGAVILIFAVRLFGNSNFGK